MQMSEPCCFRLALEDSLNQNFENRWIGEGTDTSQTQPLVRFSVSDGCPVTVTVSVDDIM